MWKTKVFRFKTIEGREVARAKMNAWLERNHGRIQWEQVFVNNAYGVTYRPLRRVY